MDAKKFIEPLAFLALGLWIIWPSDMFKWVAGVGIIVAALFHFVGK